MTARITLAAKTKGNYSCCIQTLLRVVRFSRVNDDLEVHQLPEIMQDFAKSVEAEIKDYMFELTYDYWTSEQILRAILPDDLEVPTSFETIGHIGNYLENH